MFDEAPKVEGRSQQRRPYHSTAYIVLDAQRRLAVRTLDISLGGLSIAADFNPRRDTRFDLRLTLAPKSGGRIELQTSVAVVHSIFGSTERRFRIGLRFLDPESVARPIALHLAE